MSWEHGPPPSMATHAREARGAERGAMEGAAAEETAAEAVVTDGWDPKP